MFSSFNLANPGALEVPRLTLLNVGRVELYPCQVLLLLRKKTTWKSGLGRIIGNNSLKKFGARNFKFQTSIQQEKEEIGQNYPVLVAVKRSLAYHCKYSLGIFHENVLFCCFYLEMLLQIWMILFTNFVYDLNLVMSDIDNKPHTVNVIYFNKTIHELQLFRLASGRKIVSLFDKYISYFIDYMKYYTKWVEINLRAAIII